MKKIRLLISDRDTFIKRLKRQGITLFEDELQVNDLEGYFECSFKDHPSIQSAVRRAISQPIPLDIQPLTRPQSINSLVADEVREEIKKDLGIQ